MRDAYALRRGVLMDGLKRLGFEVPVAPRGAFYVFADARRFDADSRRLSLATSSSEAHVAVTPGVDFGAAGEGYLRFSCTRRRESAELARSARARSAPRSRR